MASTSNALPSTSDNMENTRSKAKNSIHGGVYQWKLLMLFAYRGLRNRYNFRLGTEIKEAKKFDDLVFEYKNGNIKTYRLLQAKHKAENLRDEKITAESLLTETDGDYSLTKYFFSYQELKKEKLFDKCEIQDLIVFTNIDLDLNSLAKSNVKVKLLENDDNILSFEDITKPLRYRFTKETVRTLKPKLESYNLTLLARRLVICLLEDNPIKHHDRNDVFFHYHLVLADKVINIHTKRFQENFLKNTDLSGKTQVFRTAFQKELERKTKLAVENLNQTMDENLKISNKKIGLKLSKNFGRGLREDQIDWPEHVISEVEIEGFFQHLVFAVNQPNQDELGTIVKRDLNYEFDIACLDSVYSKYQDMVVTWIQGEEKFLSCDKFREFFEEETKVRCILFHISDPVTSFTGRVEELNRLHGELHKLETSNAAQSTTVAICGLGGIGKSELVKKYISLHCKKYAQGMVWIDAESIDSLSASFKLLAHERLKIKLLNLDNTARDIKSIVEDVYRFFSSGDCLFVFDNADNLCGKNGLSEFLPLCSSKIFVLITSRNCLWEGIPVKVVAEWTKAEAAEFVRNALEIENDAQEDEVHRLSETLQHFPLALQQAVAYIKIKHAELENFSKKFDISDYLNRFDEETKKLLDFNLSKESGNKYTKTTFTTWTITIDNIKKYYQNGCIAIKILNKVAFMAADFIPTDIFLLSVCQNEETVGSAFQLLKQFSIASAGPDPRHPFGEGRIVLSVHRLVQLVTELHLRTQQNDEESLVEALNSIISYYFLHRREKLLLVTDDISPHLQKILSKFDALCTRRPEDKARLEESYIKRLLQVLSDVYYDLGDIQSARVLLERALEIERRCLRIDNSKHAGLLINLGNIYRRLGLLDKASSLQTEGLKLIKKFYGDAADHFEVAMALVSFGCTLWEKAIEDHSPDRPQRVACLNLTDMADTEHFELYKALKNLAKTVEGEELVLASDLLKAKEIDGLAAKIYQLQAKQIFKFSVEIDEKGKNIFNNSDDYYTATQMYKQALGILKRHFLKIIEKNLKTTLQKLGKGKHKQCSKCRKNYHGFNRVEIAKYFSYLANNLRMLDHYNEANKLEDAALKLKEQEFPTNHLELALVLDCLGNTFREIDNFIKATELHETSLQIKENHYGREDFEVAKTLNNLGNTLLKLRRFDEATKLQRRALKITIAHFSATHFEVTSMLDSLGNISRETGLYTEAKKFGKVSLRIKEKHFESHPLEVAKTLNNLGNTMKKLQQFDKAKEYQDRALKIKITCFKAEYSKGVFKHESYVPIGVAYV